MKTPKYRIIRTRSKRYYIQKKWLCFWITHRPIKSPTYMESKYMAEKELQKIKDYEVAKQEIVHEE